MNFTICIYAKIDGFPPTLNFINSVSNKNYSVKVVELSIKKTTLGREVDKHISIAPEIRNSMFANYKVFLKFIRTISSLLKEQKQGHFVSFDIYSLVAIRIANLLNPRTRIKVWYHNHDVAKASKFKLFSLGWIAHLLEYKLVSKATFFTLPSEERKSFYKNITCDSVLPNYPAKHVYSDKKSNSIGSNGPVKLIFQGRITDKHCLDIIIDIINKSKKNAIELLLKGLISDSLKHKFSSLISVDRQSQLTFLGYTEYKDLPEITASCHIGIAIIVPDDFMRETLGTASNKIYEYVACGLPILYFNHPHFNKYLHDYPWAFPVDTNYDSINSAIQSIVANYDELSLAAKSTFEDKLNYEHHFDKTLTLYLEKTIN